MNIHYELANVRSAIRELTKKVEYLQGRHDWLQSQQRSEVLRQQKLRIVPVLADAKARLKDALEKEQNLIFDYIKGV
jgi:hypothetical protein